MLLVVFMTGTVEAAGDQLFGLSLEELLKVKVTTSTRTSETLQSVPAAITVFTHEQLEQMGANYVHEILALVPGFQVQRSADAPNSYSYSARGRRNGSQSKEILLLLDGRAVNDPRTGASNSSITQIPLELVEKIEIIRGPGSALYGANAHSGVINITTRKKHSEVGVGLGSNSQAAGFWTGTAEIKEWRLDWHLNSVDDAGDHYNLDDNFNPDPKVRIDSRDPQQFRHWELSINNGSSEWHYLKQTTQSEAFYNVESLNNSFNFFNISHQQLDFRHTFDWNERIHSELQLGVIETEQDFSLQITARGSLATISNPPSEEAMLGYVILAGRTKQFRWHTEWRFNDKQNFQFGLEWLSNDETYARARTNFDLQQLTEQNFPVDYYADFTHSSKVGTEQSREAKAFYVQFLQTLNQDYLLTLGARVDSYNDVGDYVSPRVALVREINSNNSLKLLYGEAFRAPALNETQLVNNPVLVGNSELKHEIVKTWDLIWAGNWASQAISLGLFHSRYIDPVNSEIVFGNTRQFQNVATQSSSGVELEMSQQLNESWQIRETLSYFNHLPDFSFREADTLASLLFNFHWQEWNWNFSAAYQGEKEFLSDDTLYPLDSYWDIRSKLFYQFPTQWKLAIQVKNLLDDQYQSAASGNRLTEGVPNRGREIQFSLSRDF